MAGFGPKHPHIALLEGNAVAELTQGNSLRTAASEATLSGGGLHAARFTVRKGSYVLFGVIRADWDVKGGRDAHKVQGHCFYNTYNGRRFPGNSNWEGMQPAKEGDRIDLLLDLGAGSMIVFKNGERLGVMGSGLGGAGVEYRWAVSLLQHGDSARIDALPAAEFEALVQARERERLAALEKGVFFPRHPHITLLEGNAVAEKKSKYGDSFHRAAASEATLSGGQHAARFTVRKGSLMSFGVIRADWDVKGGESALFVQGHCFYYTGNGERFPGNSSWGGMQTAKEESDCIDLLLDLGAGSMIVFKNGERLGVMQESGLGGAGVEYRWAVVLRYKGDSARIDAVPAAEVEALVQAREVQAAQRKRERLEREARRELERLAALEMGVFFPKHPHITLLEDNAVAELIKGDGSFRAAASEATLSGGGLHAARFTVRKGSGMMFGVIRADWDTEGRKDAGEVEGHCFYNTLNRKCYPDRSDWEGMQSALEGDRIDLLLDLGVGSMSVFKNGELLGVTQESGLGGADVEYRWAVALVYKGDSARIDAVPAAEFEALAKLQEAHAAQQERERLAQEAQEARERERERPAYTARVAQRGRDQLALIASEQDLCRSPGWVARV